MPSERPIPNPSAPPEPFRAPHPQVSEVRRPELGMTLRDWFAGQALCDLAACEMTPNEIAQEAYKIADAMLRERDRTS